MLLLNKNDFEKSTPVFIGVSALMSRASIETVTADDQVKVVTGWMCTVCGYKSRYKHVCSDHISYKHMDPEPIRCSFCGKIFMNRPSHRKHQVYCRLSST